MTEANYFRNDRLILHYVFALCILVFTSRRKEARMLSVTQLGVAIALSLFLFGGCETTLPIGTLLFENEPLPGDLSFSLVNDPDDSCLMKLEDESMELPTFEQAVAEVERDALLASSCGTNAPFSLWRIGECGDGQLLFISFGFGDFVSTSYFDSGTKRLVGITETTDVLVPGNPCGGSTFKIARIDCEDPTVTRTLCP